MSNWLLCVELKKAVLAWGLVSFGPSSTMYFASSIPAAARHGSTMRAGATAVGRMEVLRRACGVLLVK
jgi:hypothetical protein